MLLSQMDPREWFEPAMFSTIEACAVASWVGSQGMSQDWLDLANFIEAVLLLVGPRPSDSHWLGSYRLRENVPNYEEGQLVWVAETEVCGYPVSPVFKLGSLRLQTVTAPLDRNSRWAYAAWVFEEPFRASTS